MAKKRATLTDLLNDLTYKVIFDEFKLIAINLFEWSGLPEGLEERFIETYLFEDGKAVFFKDPEMSFMCLRTDDSAPVCKGYGEPSGWWATGYDYHKFYDKDDCVLIANNKLRIATREIVTFYANKLAEAERTMDVNVKACKTPYIFACDENDVLTFKQIFQKVDGNEPAIYADRSLNMDSLQVLQTGVKFLGNELQDYKNTVKNELLTFLGVNNVSVDKKERLITQEAESNDQLIQSFCDIQLEARQKACEEINTKYSLNVSVQLRAGSVEKSVETVENKEDNENE